MNRQLLQLAANCGIDARAMTIQQLKEAYQASIAGRKFLDQHDMRLQEALERA